MMQIGRAAVRLFGEKGRRPRLMIGRDPRLSGPLVERALCAGILSAGGDALLIEDPIPTPAVAHLTRAQEADAGIVISASHNPFYDNGIKIFDHRGFKLSEEKEAALESLVNSGACAEKLPVDDGIGRIARLGGARRIYIDFLKDVFPKGQSLEGPTIVLDCANGATSFVAPKLFSELGAQIYVNHNEPDGLNINRHCGALHPEILSKEVVEHRADLGFAFDGDGDRLIAVDERGRILTGDQVLAVCAVRMKKEGTLANDLLVTTVMSNIGLDLAMARENIRHVRTRVGDRHVLEEMQARGAVVGGEDSGHMIFLENHTTGDGLVSALRLIHTMKSEGKNLSELSEVMTVYPQKVINVAVKKKPDLAGVPEIAGAVRAVEEKLGSRGRVLVRYSGTEPLCRVMVEGPTPEDTERCCGELAEIVRSILG
jgi:phosphoglucosamine mutase